MSRRKGYNVKAKGGGEGFKVAFLRGIDKEIDIEIASKDKMIIRRDSG